MYPVGLNITGKLCVVIGGGMVAERKVRGLLAASGRVRVVSPKLTPGLEELALFQRIEWQEASYHPSTLAGAFLVFAATSNPAVQAAVLQDAREAGLLINMADDPAACDFQVAATVRRGDLLLSVATSGRSPAVAAMVRQRLEREFGEEYALLTSLMARLRHQVLTSGEMNAAAKKILFQQLLHDEMIDWLRDRRWDLLQQHLESVLGGPVALDWETLTKENT